VLRRGRFILEEFIAGYVILLTTEGINSGHKYLCGKTRTESSFGCALSTLAGGFENERTGTAKRKEEWDEINWKWKAG
jgi:hypothetical protein